MADTQNPVTPEQTTQPVATPATPEPKPVSSAASAASVQPSAASRAPEPSAASGPRQLRDDEEPTEQDASFTISQKAFRDRMARAQRKVLKEILGTDDPAKAKALAEEYRALIKEKEERRLAEMTELEREREKRRQLRREHKDFKREVHQREVTRAVNEVEDVVTNIVKGVVKEKAMKHAIRDFQEAVSKMSEEEADALYNRDSITAWFQNYAKEYECGIEREPRAEPLNVGTEHRQTARPLPPPSGSKTMSTKGGMSKKEVNDRLKAMGLSVRI